MKDEHLEVWRNTFIDWLQKHWIHGDGAHDIEHLHRVWRNCQRINAGEGSYVDILVLLAATYFHDIVTVPKNDPRRNQSSLLSAERTAEVLKNDFRDFSADKIESVKHAIHAHSFSANVKAQTIEAKILQDADRMEALGAIGIARMFYTAGKMNAQMFHAGDPSGLRRNLDDSKYALDHVALKLLNLPSMMQTATGRKLAEEEAGFIKRFREKLLDELTPMPGR